ncbi:MAG TPA: menaquinone biosynthesis protein [Tepidisphaeraceae bacterium]|nr:menaquinone biosynthesis protein [Tepidisphaeraceae bacterium]
MSSSAAITPARRPKQATRIGSVSYLNAKPLIYGLDEADDLQLTLDVPSKLIDGLRERRFDVALLPVIDYQRLPGLRILTSGGIGSDGPTLTVRIFSKVPIEQITRLACDTDSHTSVALARIILAESFNLHARFIDWNHEERTPAEARLLIGDKVVCEEPPGFDHQLDLGEAWKRLTGMPFVFAAWMAREGVELGDLPQRLEDAKREGLQHAVELVERFAVPRGWPAELALQYLTVYLKYDIGDRQLVAIRKFYELATKHQIIAHPPAELTV